ncbi:MAG: ribbon-helix-helix protein, CopG family [Thermoleophilaceae bacterium]
MRKTSVYLTNEESEELRRIAIRAGRPQAELIREGVRHVIAEAGAERRTFRSLGKGRGGGDPYRRWGTDLYDRAMGKR